MSWYDAAGAVPVTGRVRCRAVQSRCRALPPYPEAASPGHQLSGLRCSLRQRGGLTIWFTEEATAAWEAEPRTTRGGQSRYSALAIVTAPTLRAVFRLALRQTEGLIGFIIALLGLDLAVPDHTTLSRRAESLDAVRPRPGPGPVHLLVDSRSLKLYGSGEWLLEKHGTKTRRSWRKLHIAVDTDTRQIATTAVTTNDVDDASQVGSLLDHVDGPVTSFTADGAYDQDGVYSQVTARHPGAAVIVPPRSSAVPSDMAERHGRDGADHARPSSADYH